jgi:hypothetical protein
MDSVAQECRLGHPPIQSGRYTTDAKGVINGITDIQGLEVGFTGKQIGQVIRVRTVFRIR